MKHDDIEWKLAATAFGWTNPSAKLINSGLINHSWKVNADEGIYILQNINTNIFHQPEWIDENINMADEFLQKHSPDYLFTKLIINSKGDSLIKINQHFYRAFKFIPNSTTISVVNNAHEAFEASKQFALFTSKLAQFPVSKLNITIPNFHNLSFRYKQFEDALLNNNTKRMVVAEKTINTLKNLDSIVREFEKYIQSADSTQRVMHHDTKISNVLFDVTGKGLCVIDLDTLMPGYAFSDVGDMCRTYLSPVSEEELNFDKITIRKEVLSAIENGYLSELKSALSQFEIDNFYLSGKILIYMQSIRFLTDYLQNDNYYGEKYPDNNLIRAQNQLRLLELYIEAVH
jgi:Ser/Thr protein kinase RdoA (MazF antagonist)